MKAAFYLALGVLLAIATAAHAEDGAQAAAPSADAGIAVVEFDLTGGVGATGSDPANVVVIQQIQPQSSGTVSAPAASLRYVGTSAGH